MLLVMTYQVALGSPDSHFIDQCHMPQRMTTYTTAVLHIYIYACKIKMLCVHGWTLLYFKTLCIELIL